MTRVKAAATLAVAMLAAGCASSGLSHREFGRNTQASYLNAMYATGASTQPAARRPFSGPAALAVAQVGETSPPQPMLDALRKESALFRRVESIPAIGGEPGYVAYRNGLVEREDAARRQVEALRNLAAAAGADYLLLVGGTVDRTTGSTALSVFNLTIVGLFIVPSERTQALMKASGAVIDARTGQVVTLASTELRRDILTPYASSDADVLRLLGRMRDEVTRELAVRVIDACRDDANAPAAKARW
jgi:hypothetical protein